MQLTRGGGIGRGGEAIGHGVDFDGLPLACTATDVVDVLVVHQGKKPGAQIRIGLP
jgi:hypothetical protein